MQNCKKKVSHLNWKITPVGYAVLFGPLRPLSEKMMLKCIRDLYDFGPFCNNGSSFISRHFFLAILGHRAYAP